MRWLAGFVGICLAACSSVDTPVIEPDPQAAPAAVAAAGRLGTDVVPLHYDLALSIVPDRERFTGTVEIRVDIRVPVERIYLHGLNLDVREVVLRGQTVREGTYTQMHETGLAEIVFSGLIPPQQASLEIRYEAPFGHQLKGLYRVRDGGRWYAFTQFEPISAREAFPSFDEPAFKVPFDLSVSVQAGHAVISSTPELERIPLENGLERVRFATTAPLPTYLIAFAVGPLDVVNAPAIPATALRPAALPLRGVAAAGKGGGLGYALGTTPALLEWQEDYFAIAYPYPKLDIIAVPDLAAGAMENVGAITYRESLLLLDDRAPVIQRRRHALINAHELAHQWFGNLVTMPWWDDIWLNEAFATWMAYKTVAAWDPSHKAGLSRLNRLRGAMREDALASARQIRQPVLDHNDIENAFDGITYSKGGAVLNMVERYLGEERFRDAIRAYIRRHAYGNADVNDFIASLSDVGGDDIAAAMRSFIFQPGIPLLQVELICDDAGAGIRVAQSRYLPVGSGADPSLRWTVPMCFVYGNADERHEQCAMVDDDIETVGIEHMRCPDWVLPNAGFAGYYHWAQPGEAYAGLMAAGKKLTAVEQLSIADSIDAGLASGRLTVAQAADAFAGLAKSRRPQVALSPTDFINETYAELAGDNDTVAGLKQYARSLYGGAYGADAFDIAAMDTLPSDTGRLFLVDVAAVQAWAGDREVRSRAHEGALQWTRGRSQALPPESVQLALRLGLEEEHALAEPLIERLRDSRDGHERATILKALARAEVPKLSSRLYDLMLTDDIRISEIRLFFREHLKQSLMRRAAWAWIQRNFDALVARLPPRDAGRLPAAIAAGLCDEDEVAPVERFLTGRMQHLVGGPRNVDKAVEAIQLCARRAELQRPQAAAYFGRAVVTGARED